jgi:hypothetical protein
MSSLLATESWVAERHRVTARRPSLALRPDDRLYVAMLAAWVLLVTVVGYVLLGWAGAGAILAGAMLVGIVTIVVQSRERARSNVRS